jgi:hypothetical protein
MDRDHYLRPRKEHEPKIIKLVIVAESPPASGKYFTQYMANARPVVAHARAQRWTLNRLIIGDNATVEKLLAASKALLAPLYSSTDNRRLVARFV